MRCKFCGWDAMGQGTPAWRAAIEPAALAGLTAGLLTAHMLEHIHDRLIDVETAIEKLQAEPALREGF